MILHPQEGGTPSTAAAPAGTPVLRRDLGLVDAVGVGFGAIVGAGIFVVTGVAAGVAGPAFLVGLVIAAIAATCNALSSAQLAAEYPQAGGTYEYGYRVLSPWAGYVAGWMFLASKIAAAGTVALGLAGYLDALLPGLHPRAMAVGAIGAFTVLNYFGVKRSSRANLPIVAISLGTLLLFVLAGIPSFRLENLGPFAPTGWRGVMESSAILFFLTPAMPGSPPWPRRCASRNGRSHARLSSRSSERSCSISRSRWSRSAPRAPYAWRRRQLRSRSPRSGSVIHRWRS